MSKRRGRPRLKADERKDAKIGLRLNKALLTKVERAAQVRGVMPTREIADRLAASFEDTGAEHARAIRAAFGGDKTFSFLLLVAQALKALRDATGHSWHEDAYTFDQAVHAVLHLFGKVRPAGPAVMPSDMPAIEGYVDDGLDIKDVRAALSAVPYGRDIAESVFGMAAIISIDPNYFTLKAPENSEGHKRIAVLTSVRKALEPLYKRALKKKGKSK
jgi:hypothetical protein